MVEKLTTVCGSTIFVTVRQKREKRKEKRAAKVNPSSDKVIEVNQRNAEKELAMLLNHNFSEGDLHIVLTYKEIPTREEAAKAYEKFIRACRKRCKAAGKVFKAISATEYHNSRIHHHIVLNYRDVEEINKLWKSGYVKIAVLDNSGDYRRLAAYLIKETSKTFRNPDAFSRRRYNCTRSVEKPVTKIEEVSVLHLLEDPKAIKDYYIDADSVYRGINPFSERPYLEYVMISVNAEAPRLNSWKRGKAHRERNQYSKWLRENLGTQLGFSF